MATSNAARQAAYRARHLVDVDGAGERLNMVVSVQAKAALKRLAVCYGVTQKEMLEQLIGDAERIASSTDPEKYFRGELHLDVTQ